VKFPHVACGQPASPAAVASCCREAKIGKSSNEVTGRIIAEILTIESCSSCLHAKFVSNFFDLSRRVRPVNFGHSMPAKDVTILCVCDTGIDVHFVQGFHSLVDSLLANDETGSFELSQF
jgi:hypothetical protein